MPKITFEWQGTEWFYTIEDAEGWLQGGRGKTVLDCLAQVAELNATQVLLNETTIPSIS